MRETALPAGSNIQSPDQITPAEPITPQTPSIAIDPKTPSFTPPPPTPEPDDEDVETVKDAAGKEVIDQRTGKPQRRVSFAKYQRAIAEMAELKKQLATTAEERHRIDERLKIINEALTTPEPKEEKSAAELDPEPDPEVNIFGWVKWNKRELQRGSDRHGRTHRRISRINSASRATRSSALAIKIKLDPRGPDGREHYRLRMMLRPVIMYAAEKGFEWNEGEVPGHIVWTKQKALDEKQ